METEKRRKKYKIIILGYLYRFALFVLITPEITIELSQ